MILCSCMNMKFTLSGHIFSFRILGNRVSELEKKLKTLEVSGLWNIPGKDFFFDFNF